MSFALWKRGVCALLQNPFMFHGGKKLIGVWSNMKMREKWSSELDKADFFFSFYFRSFQEKNSPQFLSVLEQQHWSFRLFQLKEAVITVWLWSARNSQNSHITHHPVLNSTWASNRATTGAEAALQPLTRERISPSCLLCRTILMKPGCLVLVSLTKSCNFSFNSSGRKTETKRERKSCNITMSPGGMSSLFRSQQRGCCCYSVCVWVRALGSVNHVHFNREAVLNQDVQLHVMLEWYGVLQHQTISIIA